MLKPARLEAFWINTLLNFTNLGNNSAKVPPRNNLNGKTRLGIKRGGVRDKNTSKFMCNRKIILFIGRETQGDFYVISHQQIRFRDDL